MTLMIRGQPVERIVVHGSEQTVWETPTGAGLKVPHPLERLPITDSVHVDFGSRCNESSQVSVTDSDVYIAHKTHEVFGAVRMWQKQFSELSEERAHCFACLWVKKVLIPHLRRACVEKVEFYKQQIARKDISKTITDILLQCLEKNERYIRRIDELSEHSDIKNKSSIFTPTVL